jgi:hypothetical protein
MWIDPSFLAIPKAITLWASQLPLPLTNLEPVFTPSQSPTRVPDTWRRPNITEEAASFVYQLVYCQPPTVWSACVWNDCPLMARP